MTERRVRGIPGVARNPDFETVMQCFDDQGGEEQVAELDFNAEGKLRVTMRYKPESPTC